jgi:ribosomal protein S18 acetylase RimI-like enzyme
MPDTLPPFHIDLEVQIRPCRQDDLPALEWFGLFTSHRTLIRAVFEQHQSGEAVMLVAQVNGEASGQVWIDLRRQLAGGTAELWALRVLPCLQRCGIGTRLVAAAEQAAADGGCSAIELAVETDAPRVRRLYERLGYHWRGTTIATHQAGPPRRTAQWLLTKDLRATPHAGSMQ